MGVDFFDQPLQRCKHHLQGFGWVKQEKA